jgi:hypothetical protein
LTCYAVTIGDKEMIKYVYKADFNFDLGSGTSEAENLLVATSLVEDDLCESYNINKDDIKSISFNEA